MEGTKLIASLRLSLIGLFLIPFDLLLRLIGPQYRLFFLFFATTPPGMVAWLGRLRAIRAGASAAKRVVKASGD